MADLPTQPLPIESKPSPADVRVLEERLYQFNVEATGIADGGLYGIFLRDGEGAVIGGAEGWTWGGTCFVRNLFVPAAMRKHGYGSQLMAQIEAMARARQCDKILLETHDFQAPDFYRRLGFILIATIEGSPRGHRKFTFMKPLDAHRA